MGDHAPLRGRFFFHRYDDLQGSFQVLASDVTQGKIYLAFFKSSYKIRTKTLKFLGA